MLRDLKYLFTLSAPIFVFTGLYLGGIFSVGVTVLAFLIIPFLELFLPGSIYNLTPEEEAIQNDKKVFDYLLYINIPLQWGLIFYFLVIVSTRELHLYELVAMTINVGIMNGYCINIAHELGHRNNNFDRFISAFLLIPSHYLHFLIEHNLGHHKKVSTLEDPASSRFNETIYAFYVRSVIMSYVDAWKIETNILKREGKAFFSVHNRMFHYIVIHALFLGFVAYTFGSMALIATIFAGIIGFLLLESVNYIEHYGLNRRKLANGHYEPVKQYHSWNSNHELGRIFLFELTRHSDHHFKSTRKYQVLRHFDESPELPFGYPGCILVALVPPLWFKIMNKRVLEYTNEMQDKVVLAVSN